MASSNGVHRDAYHDHLGKAEDLIEQGQPDAARPELDTALALNPKGLEAYLLRAQLLEDTDWQAALADYNQAVQLDPSGEALVYRAAAYAVAADDLEHAVADLNAAIDRGYDPPALAYQIGDLYFSEGQFDHAVTQYSRAITLGHDMPLEVYWWQGHAYLGLRQLADALKAYRLSHRHGGTGAPVLAGMVCLAMENPIAALEWFAKAGDDHDVLPLLVSAAHLLAGDRSAARRALKAADDNPYHDIRQLAEVWRVLLAQHAGVDASAELETIRAEVEAREPEGITYLIRALLAVADRRIEQAKTELDLLLSDGIDFVYTYITYTLIRAAGAAHAEAASLPDWFLREAYGN